MENQNELIANTTSRFDYVNNYEVIANHSTHELYITLKQEIPKFDPEKDEPIQQPPNVVGKIVVPFSVALNLIDGIKSCMNDKPKQK